MNTIRNIHFTLLIRIDNRLHEFNFRMRKDDIYDGDTSDDRGARHYFRMVHDGSAWQLEGSILPAWIETNKERISKAFAEKTAA